MTGWRVSVAVFMVEVALVFLEWTLCCCCFFWSKLQGYVSFTCQEAFSSSRCLSRVQSVLIQDEASDKCFYPLSERIKNLFLEMIGDMVCKDSLLAAGYVLGLRVEL